LETLFLEFIDFRWLDLVDIFLVAVLLFTTYKLLKGTAATNILLGIMAIFLLWKVVNALKMTMLSEILGAFISGGFIALIIIFQPEIREFLFALGTTTFWEKYGQKAGFLKKFFKETYELDIDPVIVACNKMSEIKQGALIIITRQNELKQYVQTGTLIDGIISSLLIENIFFKNSPLHDGAMIITKNRIKAAACIMPVTKKRIKSTAGLRHRAAVGITEISDAIAIVVSEETGNISYSIKGEIKYNIPTARLQSLLITDLGLDNKEQA
jgi:uncharacterized protein (TIGR00159 family)